MTKQKFLVDGILKFEEHIYWNYLFKNLGESPRKSGVRLSAASPRYAVGFPLQSFSQFPMQRSSLFLRSFLKDLTGSFLNLSSLWLEEFY